MHGDRRKESHLQHVSRWVTHVKHLSSLAIDLGLSYEYKMVRLGTNGTTGRTMPPKPLLIKQNVSQSISWSRLQMLNPLPLQGGL
jgi:hypothetical protein